MLELSDARGKNERSLLPVSLALAEKENACQYKLDD